MKKSKVARAIKNGTFIPTMQPTYAQYDEVMESHRGKTQADIKYDGYRVQIHKRKDRTKIFTRNGNELNYRCYPDVMQILERMPTGIFEAELVGKGDTHKQMFDKVKRRFRREGIKEESVERYLESGIVQEVPLHLRLFDVLKFEGRKTADQRFEERRRYVERIDERGVLPAETDIVHGRAELEKVVEQTFGRRGEGRVCKDLDSKYMPGHKGIEWVKFKRTETLDLVVIGFYKTDPYLKEPYTSVLCATYNKNTGLYETIGKIGTRREGIAYDIDRLVGHKKTSQWQDKIFYSEKIGKGENQVPNWRIDPEDSIVLEVKAMNINYNKNWQSCGLSMGDDGKAYSMRIAWAKQIREDKNPRQATTTQDIAKLYALQEGKAATTR